MPPFKFDNFPDPRPRYVDQITVAAPAGTKTALRRAAEAAGKSVPDLLREAIRHAAAEAAPSGAREAA